VIFTTEGNNNNNNNNNTVILQLFIYYIDNINSTNSSLPSVTVDDSCLITVNTEGSQRWQDYYVTAAAAADGSVKCPPGCDCSKSSERCIVFG